MATETMKAVRWCKLGDTISTVRPLSHAKHYLHVICETPEACAYANELIAAGRWRVSRCGQCENKVEDCVCEQ